MSGPGVAVVGTAFGCLTHVRVLRAAGFDVRALVGRDPERTSARAKRFEIAHACTSLSSVAQRRWGATGMPRESSQSRSLS